jgi:MYND finger
MQLAPTPATSCIHCRKPGRAVECTGCAFPLYCSPECEQASDAECHACPAVDEDETVDESIRAGFCVVRLSSLDKRPQPLIARELPEICDGCNDTTWKPRRCGRCLGRMYCSRECQRDDWKKGHRIVCEVPTPERRELLLQFYADVSGKRLLQQLANVKQYAVMHGLIRHGLAFSFQPITDHELAEETSKHLSVPAGTPIYVVRGLQIKESSHTASNVLVVICTLIDPSNSVHLPGRVQLLEAPTTPATIEQTYAELFGSSDARVPKLFFGGTFSRGDLLATLMIDARVHMLALPTLDRLCVLPLPGSERTAPASDATA